MLALQSWSKNGWRSRNELGGVGAGRETDRDAALGAEPDFEIESVEG